MLDRPNRSCASALLARPGPKRRDLAEGCVRGEPDEAERFEPLWQVQRGGPAEPASSPNGEGEVMVGNTSLSRSTRTWAVIPPSIASFMVNVCLQAGQREIQSSTPRSSGAMRVRCDSFPRRRSAGTMARLKN